MSLTHTKFLLGHVQKNTYAAPVFNINDLEPMQRVFDTDTDTEE